MKIDRCWNSGKAVQIIFWLCLTVFLLTGCAVHPEKPPETLVQKAELSPKELMEKYAQKDAVAPSRPPLAELPPITALEPQMAMETAFPFEKMLFSIEVIDEPIGNVLLGLAMAGDLNLILGQDVNRHEPVSVKIKNLPLKTALDSIISAHNYHYTIEKNILRVAKLKTQFFTVDYPLVYSNPESQTGGDVLGGGGQGGGGGESSTAISSSGLEGEFSIEFEVEDEEEFDVWKKIDEALKPSDSRKGGLLSEKGSATINRMAGIIVVTDMPKHLQMVAQFIDRVNQALHRQVLIEAKIVEVTLSKGHSYGINWEIVSQSFGDSDLQFTKFFRPLPRNNETGLLEPLRAFTFGSVGGSLTSGFFDTTGNTRGQVVLDALATQGDVNVLSSPRLNVINNQTALISVGRVIPYLDLTITTTEDEVNGDTVLRTSSQPIIARTLEGVTLGITAQISDDGVTTLHIVPIITEQTGSRELIVENESFEVPVFSVRESDTMVRVADQQTIVIGGLIQETTNDTISKIPLLGDIPFLKMFFSHQSRQTAKTELVILLTTTIFR
ncbi:MAG: MSHA biogenesis protein MshL [Desulfobacteraceae bacterium Eth-SRB2]|nr:MAG: MSHA biogenesis protein MshL [Desulfobacteraceae bacterium Eth-SRB2]